MVDSIFPFGEEVLSVEAGKVVIRHESACEWRKFLFPVTLIMWHQQRVVYCVNYHVTFACVAWCCHGADKRTPDNGPKPTGAIQNTNSNKLLFLGCLFVPPHHTPLIMQRKIALQLYSENLSLKHWTYFSRLNMFQTFRRLMLTLSSFSDVFMTVHIIV